MYVACLILFIMAKDLISRSASKNDSCNTKLNNQIERLRNSMPP